MAILGLRRLPNLWQAAVALRLEMMLSALERIFVVARS